MVTAMDRSIGLLLDAIRDLGVENNTLVVFTSGE
jgi:arylsulfatase A-like enzyme